MIVPDGQMWIHGEESLAEHLMRRGVSRRAFLAFCSSMAAVLTATPAAATGETSGGPVVTADTVAAGLGAVRRPVLVWLQLQECTGCMESVLRAGGTTVEDVILNLVSMDYNELIMAAAGSAAGASPPRIGEVSTRGTSTGRFARRPSSSAAPARRSSTAPMRPTGWSWSTWSSRTSTASR